MTFRLIIFFVFIFQISNGQNLEFTGGLSKYNFSLEDEFKYRNSSKTDLGTSFYIGYNDIHFGIKELDSMNFRFTLGINKSKGEFFFRSGGQGGGTITNATTQKKSISIGFYPINLKFLQHLEFNVGVKYLRTISSNSSGSSSDFGLAGNEVRIIADDEEGIISKNQFGAAARIAYNIKIADNFSLTPQYNYYISLSSEFRRYISTTLIQNHFLGVGIQMAL